MPINAACTFCGKSYLLDDAVQGKKVRCKDCGNIFPVQSAGATGAAGGGGGGAADLYAGLASAANAEQRIRPKFDDEQDGPAYDLAPVKPAGSGAAFGAPIQGTAVCPGCGNNLPDVHRICMICGYDRALGGRKQTKVLSPEDAKAKRYSFRYDGVRINTPSENPTVAFLEKWGSVSGYYVFLAGVLLILALQMLAGMGSTKPLTMCLIFFTITMIYVGLFMFVIVPFMVAGVRRAGSLMKFETPENERERMVGVLTWTGIFSMPFIVIFFMSLAVVSRAARFGDKPDYVATIVTVLLLYVVFSAMEYVILKCFFRLRWGEAALAWIFMILYGLAAVVMILLVQFLFLYIVAQIQITAQTMKLN